MSTTASARRRIATSLAFHAEVTARLQQDPALPVADAAQSLLTAIETDLADVLALPDDHPRRRGPLLLRLAALVLEGAPIDWVEEHADA